MRSGYRTFLICLCLILTSQAACKQSGSGDGTGGISAVAIGPEGGIVATSEQGSGLSGAQVYIPRNALESSQNISLVSTELPRALPNGYRAAGRCISFSPDGAVFKQPVKLYLPYTDVNNDGIVDGKAVHETRVSVLYYNERTGRWEKLNVSGRDEEANLAIVDTMHFSTYVVSINTTDTQTLDSSVPTDTTDPALFTSGDCLVGDGNVIGGNVDSCYYYNLTVTRRSTGLLAVIDRHATFVRTGIPATISPEGDSATFDAASAFSKVLASGSASQWTWECEFVQEHTYLQGYEVRYDALIPGGSSDTEPPADGAYAGIQAVDANMVRITWPFDVSEQIEYMSTDEALGHRLVIRFRAAYL